MKTRKWLNRAVIALLILGSGWMASNSGAVVETVAQTLVGLRKDITTIQSFTSKTSVRTGGVYAHGITVTALGSAAPFTINSTKVNTNLNADLLDGQHYTNIQSYAIGLTTGAWRHSNVDAKFNSIAVTSAGLVANLNSDLLDSQQGSYYTGYSDAVSTALSHVRGVLETADTTYAASLTGAIFHEGTLRAIADTFPAGMTFAVNTGTSAIDTSGARIDNTGANKYILYNDLYDYWRGDGTLSARAQIILKGSTSDSWAASTHTLKTGVLTPTTALRSALNTPLVYQSGYGFPAGTQYYLHQFGTSSAAFATAKTNYIAGFYVDGMTTERARINTYGEYAQREIGSAWYFDGLSFAGSPTATNNRWLTVNLANNDRTLGWLADNELYSGTDVTKSIVARGVNYANDVTTAIHAIKPQSSPIAGVAFSRYPQTVTVPVNFTGFNIAISNFTITEYEPPYNNTVTSTVVVVCSSYHSGVPSNLETEAVASSVNFAWEKGYEQHQRQVLCPIGDDRRVRAFIDPAGYKPYLVYFAVTGGLW